MKPKKKDRLVSDESKSQFERLQADHEMFLQAFEKPTQIYRYLRSRNIVSPIFLNRGLSYMSGRSLRNKNTRQSFKVDSLLADVEARHRKENPNYSYKSEFMNLAFTGFLDQCEVNTLKAEVDVSLLKICHKKRKDVSSPVLKVNLGKVVVPINPVEPVSPSKQEVFSVGSENFSHNNGHSVKSYALLFRVICEREDLPAALVNGICNGDINEDIDDPPPKRLCRSNPVMTNTSNLPNEPDQSDPDSHVQNCQPHTCHTTYGAELIVYDKYQRCLLMDGEYELALQDMNIKPPSKKQASWETVMDGRAVGPFEVFNKCPTLKFKLSWSDNPLLTALEEQEDAELPMEIAAEEDGDDDIQPIVPKHLLPRLEHLHKQATANYKPCIRKRIFYQFLYNNNTRQQTEARDDLHCPWCSLPCIQLYPLLKHLRCCHARFSFTFVEHPKGARIDVSINQCYDGAYVGNPQDLHSHIGYAFSRNGPVRRTPVTHLLIYKQKKPNFDLAEFMEPETEAHSTRHTVQGHNRLYYHTVTCQPVRPCEIENDSEDENDPLWLRQKTMTMIDDFTDVNEGEKQVMKMWNLHVMHHNFIGDCQMAKACASFIQDYGVCILEQNLVRNFVLHLVNLYDFGLMRPEVVYRSMMLLLQLRNQLESEGKLGNSSDFIDTNMGRRLQQLLAKCSQESDTVTSFPQSMSSQEEPS